MRKLKTVVARAKAIIRARHGHRPNSLVWVRAYIDGNNNRRNYGTTGIALSEAQIRYFKAADVRRIVVAYGVDDMECFADCFETVMLVSELESPVCIVRNIPVQEQIPVMADGSEGESGV